MRTLLRSLIVTLFCLAVTLVYVSTTQRGLKLLWQGLEPLLPAGLSIESVQGRLTGPLTVRGLKFRSDELRLTLDYAELEWTPPRLLSGVVQLDRLILEDIHYSSSEQASPPAAKPMAVPEQFGLPLAVNLEQLTVRNLAFDTASDAETFRIEQGEASLSYRDMALEIHRASVESGDFQVRGSGRLETAGEYPLEAVLDWHRARWPLDGTPQLESPAGHLRVHGSPDNYRVDGRMTLSAPGYTGADLSWQGRGSQDALQLSELAIKTLQGQLQGSAMIAWRPRIETSIDLNGSALDPGLIFPDWPGQLDVQLAGRAEFSPAGLVAQLPRLRLSGQLRQHPVQLETQGSYQKDTLRIKKFTLVSGSSSLKLGGAIGASLALDWKLDSPDLHTLLPAASGRLDGEGRVSGTLAAPVGRATLSGSDLHYGNDRLSDIELNAAVDTSAATASNLELKLGKGLIQGVAINRIELRADGIPSRHKLKLSADTSLVQGQLEALGSWAQNLWSFDLQEARLSHPDYAPWTLLKAFHGQLGKGRLTMDPSCWRSAGARLCLAGDFSSETRNGEVELRDLPLAYFAGLLPAGVQAQGTLELDGEMKQKKGQPAGTALRLDSHALALVFPPQGNRPAVRIESSSATLNLHGNADSTRLEGAIVLDNDTRLSVDADISGTDQDFLGRRLTGRARMEIPDIAFLSDLTPQLSDTRGSLQGSVQISGNLRAPVLEGKISTTDTRLVLNEPGVTLENVEMSLQGHADGEIALNLSAQSGDGELTVKGHSKLYSKPRTARFRIRGHDFQVMNTREANISASPDLNLAVNGNQLDIDGEIRIPSANIRPKKLPESSVQVSPDQIIVSADGETGADKKYQLSSRIRFILGEQVKIDGFGLKGRITGNLIAKDRPGKPTTASGELAIHDGKYRAYGQNLDIRTGRLLFAGGPITEPGLDVEAVRRPAPDILVGVKARGNMRHPEFSLFSEPAMSQSDQLSWLVLGRPLESDAPSQDRNSINQAAILLGLGGGLALTEEYGKKVGIDEISIESNPDDETNQASLLVGKYLSPQLFVSYGVGIFEPVSTLRLRYALGSKWKLLGESSALRSSADLFYVIELGK